MIEDLSRLYESLEEEVKRKTKRSGSTKQDSKFVVYLTQYLQQFAHSPGDTFS